MFNCYCSNNDEIANNLRNIVRMQKEAVREEIDSEMCSDITLGCGRREKINTRPLQIFTHDDKAWGCPIFRNEDGCEDNHKTCVFRVEKIEGCTATFRALVQEEGNAFDNNPCRPGRYRTTDSFKTIKLGDISAVRCLNDTFVNLCIR